jgi:hypothetical protein
VSVGAAGGKPEEVNGGGLSPRKGYTRAPYDDWRRKDGNEDEDGGGWRTSGAAGSKRWNAPPGGGWRDSRFGDRDLVNGGPVNSRWKDPPTGEFSRGGRGGRREHFGRSQRGTYSRQDSDSLPEWASEDPVEAGKTGGSFDASGKFQASKSESRKNGGEFDDSPDDDEFDWQKQQQCQQGNKEKDSLDDGEDKVNPVEEEEEEIDPDDLPENNTKRHVPSQENTKTQAKTLEPNIDESIPHLDAGSLVSQLVDDDDDDLELNRPSPNVPQPRQIQPEPEEPTQWLYLDPQGNTQGPFPNEDMMEWFSAGYFPRELMLRRTKDQHFVPLDEMSRLFGRVPFEVGPQPPFLKAQQQPQPTAHGAPSEQIQDRASPNQPGPPAIDHRILLEKVRVDMQLAPEDFQALLTAQPQIVLERMQHLQLQIIEQQRQHQLQQQQQQQQQQQPSGMEAANILLRTHPEHLFKLAESGGLGSLGLNTQEQAEIKEKLHQLQMLHMQRRQQELQREQESRNQQQASQSQQGYDPIKSLLSQLQDPSEPLHQQPAQAQRTPSPLQQQAPNQHQIGGFGDNVNRSIWDVEPNQQQQQQKSGNPPTGSGWEETPPPEPRGLQQFVVPEVEQIGQGADTDDGFVQPKSQEKKDKKSRKADERRRQKEAKKVSEKKYIPGMTGRPEESPEPDETLISPDSNNGEQRLQQREALIRLQVGYCTIVICYC